MNIFPKLKTGSVAQYPIRTQLSFNTRMLRFVDGVEQCYRQAPVALHRWIVRLELLDESEVAALAAFFGSQQGAAGTFTFIDPGDGREYENCSFDQHDCEVSMTDEMRAEMTLAIRENRA